MRTLHQVSPKVGLREVETPTPEQRAAALLVRMSLDEKLGQMNQLNGCGGYVADPLAHAIRVGHVGSVINEVDPDTVRELQRIAVEETRLGIPLLIGRDVIHGFKTIFPIPIGLASSWSPTLVQQTARYSAIEASESGINWTFSPMIDISRDPRWGRVAESFGEDPVLCGELAKAMVSGYQGDSLTDPTSIAACAKHFVGYGASESGRDYNTTNISEHDLRNIYLPPFKACSDIGAMTFMTSFSDLNGVPLSANRYLLSDVLRDEWGYQGFVVSDWASVQQLTDHGIAETDKDAADLALKAGVDMEMVSQTFLHHAPALLSDGHVQQAKLDQSVLRILTAKFALGLFEQPYAPTGQIIDPEDCKALACEAAAKSCVLLQNNEAVLPLESNQLAKITVLGPLANDPYEQLGTWIFDGEPERSVTLLQGLQNLLSESCEIAFEPVFASSRDHSEQRFARAFEAVNGAQAVVLCAGEEAILSGEAHCRAEISLPGAQQAFIDQLSPRLKAAGIPLILVIMAGRPLTLSRVVDKVDAILYAWHPGTMGGQAIADLLLAERIPSAKLPISFPRHVGQIPLYYAQKPTGRPVTHDNYVHMDEFPMRAEQTSLGMAASHMDTYFTPQFCFGYGLTYGSIEYTDVVVSAHVFTPHDLISVSAFIHNRGAYDIEEIAQLYVRDVVACVTRPVKELKGFQRVQIKAGKQASITFQLSAADLVFYDDRGNSVMESGEFRIGIGGNSDCQLTETVRLTGV